MTRKQIIEIWGSDKEKEEYATPNNQTESAQQCTWCDDVMRNPKWEIGLENGGFGGICQKCAKKILVNNYKMLIEIRPFTPSKC